MTIEFQSLYIYLLVFVRLVGCFLFNSVFSRKDIPNMLKMGFIFVLTVLIAPTISKTEVETLGQLKELTIILLMMKELLLGLALGFVFQIFTLLLYFVGDTMDFQFGLSMAKVMDPSTNIQVSVLGGFVNFIFILFLFTTNSHLVLIKIFAVTFDYLPVSAFFSLQELPGFILDLFISTFALAVKLLIPFVVCGFTVEMCMGILMKMIPQIHIFVINIQVKILLGITLMIALIRPLSAFLDRYLLLVLDEMQKLIVLLAK